MASLIHDWRYQWSFTTVRPLSRGDWVRLFIRGLLWAWFGCSSIQPTIDLGRINTDYFNRKMRVQKHETILPKYTLFFFFAILLSMLSPSFSRCFSLSHTFTSPINLKILTTPCYIQTPSILQSSEILDSFFGGGGYGIYLRGCLSV